MTQDGQVRKPYWLLAKGVSLRVAALKTGMDEKTANYISRSAPVNESATPKAAPATSRRVSVHAPE